MSKILTLSSQQQTKKTANITTPVKGDSASMLSSTNTSSTALSIDFDDFTSSSSILEFLSKEQECCSEADAESIFQEVSRLADNSDTRSVDEILREAELLIQQQNFLGVGSGGGGGGDGNVGGNKVVIAVGNNKSSYNNSVPMQSIKLNAKYTKRIENVRPQLTAKLLNTQSSASKPTTPQSLQQTAARVVEVGSASDTTTPTLTPTPTPQTPLGNSTSGKHFAAFVENLPSVSVISQESIPQYTTTERDEDATTAQLNEDDDTDDGTDTMEEITEGIETIELMVNEAPSNGADRCGGGGGSDDDDEVAVRVKHFNVDTSNVYEPLNASNATVNHMLMPLSLSSSTSIMSARTMQQQQTKYDYSLGKRPSCSESMLQHSFVSQPQTHMSSPTRMGISLNFNATQTCSPSPMERCNSAGVRRSSMTTPDSGISYTQSTSSNTPRPYSPLRLTKSTQVTLSSAQQQQGIAAKTYCDKSVNSSPKHFISTLTSPIEPFSAITREHVLKQEIDQLQEKLKDTEERLQSLRIQHDSLSQLHRDLRENNTHLQEESEMLKLDVQHLNECANILRTELQSARTDRNEALELQKFLQTELEESRHDKKRTQEQKEKDSKVIQDLQRQCREMERILMRKHPDSVSALIVASKNPGKCANNDQENFNSRKLLEQRIAQLEADAKEQDYKAQQILANVQARFNSVQAKYETHIADLETQVLSLQEINTKLNEKIESQVRTLDYFVTKKAEKYYNNCTQTDAVVEQTAEVADSGRGSDSATTDLNKHAAVASTATQTTIKTTTTRDHSTNTIGATSNQHSASSSTSSTANSTPNTSRPNSKQSGLRKPLVTATGGSLSSALASKLPVSQSDSTISMSAYHAAAKEDAHLLATIRGMRVDLAIKDKAMQRLTRELDECKKTIRKLQREKDALKPHSGSFASTYRRNYDATHNNEQTPANTETQALKEAQNKIKLLEADYKSLHDKRLQDLKTLQTAHERELASCHETVRILQQRLTERDEAFAMQKRRKLPVDYYALKAKVSSLERRHSEREERLHMLVEALSKGRLNGALEDLLGDNNNK